MENHKKQITEALHKGLEPYIGKGITSDVIGAISNIVRETIYSFVEQGILNREKWDKDNTIIVSEKNDNEVDIILPEWMYKWLEDEEN